MVEDLGVDIGSLGADKVDKLLKDKNIQNNVCLKEKQNMSDEEIKNQGEEEKPKHKVRAKVEYSFALIKTQMQPIQDKVHRIYLHNTYASQFKRLYLSSVSPPFL